MESLKEEIQSFNQRFQPNKDQLPITKLSEHGIRSVSAKEKNKSQLKVRAFHFIPLSIKRVASVSPMLVHTNTTWVDVDEFFYFERELREFALQCLYLTNTILGECVVQRNSNREIRVVEVRPISVDQLTARERELLSKELKTYRHAQQLSFGADLELMLKSEKTGRYMNGEMLKGYQFGFDQAIALYQSKVYHPIIEIRPKPASDMNNLHRNLLALFTQLIDEIDNYQLTTITEPNPTGRFFLGGHLHFGNIPFTFKHVRVLDQFVAIPLSIVEKNPSYRRRNNYGRLGSVRKNDYNGFEYRVLPTWFQHIPNSLPLLLWVEHLLENVSRLEVPFFDKDYLLGYYHKQIQRDSIDQWVFDHQEYFVEEEDKKLFLSFVDYLKKL
ncbi:hypothetical protein DS745_16390 [Anaerobacillus alkaliphilus]|uniref:Uncharacterized protein n=1 Tax=Anaerobacillus alkaliphilus TaxID=1548597 RepID=A0A4Q0VNF4_9BACI|nr:hypothetical protein [Anaerobacillus alkaliphilus]RXI97932.1 hypothetical protein DS745_16390 [Anaerobacillus alkaliphilus]